MYVYIMIYVPWKPSVAGARFFLSLVRSGLGLCSAGRRPGYWSNLSVTEVTCPVIGRARPPGVAPGGRRRTGPGVIGCPACATETGQYRRGSVAMTFCWPLDRRTAAGLVYPYSPRYRRRVWIAHLWLITKQTRAGMTRPNYICMLLLKNISRYQIMTLTCSAIWNIIFLPANAWTFIHFRFYIYTKDFNTHLHTIFWICLLLNGVAKICDYSRWPLW